MSCWITLSFWRGHVAARVFRIVRRQGNQYKLTGLLEYYFNFFRGMYEFKQKMFVSAMMYYKRAEKNLASSRMILRKQSLLLKWLRFFTI